MSQAPANGSIVEADGVRIDLKNRYLAAVLAFLLPGAGHFYQGRTNKAYLFSVCILGLFFLGLFLGNGRVVYVAWSPEDYRIQYPAQFCVGIPAFPAIAQFYLNEPTNRQGGNPANADTNPDWSWSQFMAAPENLVELSRWHYQGSAGFELGTLFTAVAGLLNVLVIFDAFAGPMPVIPQQTRRKPNDPAKAN